ncbi:LPS assembly lipoprotein LptE [Aquabacterium sp.]|uniref:LPS-assembly lipoprotein LptE n=1 Tax=Aquabacterium sp. TaxID=1872578 RepID=UPI0035AF163C
MTVNRRQVLGTLVAATSAVALAGCGFQLRRVQPLKFQSVELAGFPSHSTLEHQLRLAIESTGTKVVESLPEAEVVLKCLAEVREQVAAVTTAAGQTRELSLRLRFRFRLTRVRDDNVLIKDSEIALARDLTYNETDALAKQQEADFLYRAMQADLVDQVMRRLASVAF